MKENLKNLIQRLTKIRIKARKIITNPNQYLWTHDRYRKNANFKDAEYYNNKNTWKRSLI